MTKEEIIETIRSHPEILERFSIQSLSLFGSVVRNEAREDSDIDILVRFRDDAHVGLLKFSRLQRELTGLLGHPVDLATPEALHPAMREHILQEAIHAA